MSEADTIFTDSEHSGAPTAPQLVADFVIPTTSEMVTARVVYERAKVISPHKCMSEECDLIGCDPGSKEGGDANGGGQRLAHVDEKLAVSLHQWHEQERQRREYTSMEAVQEFQRRQVALQELLRRQVAAAQLGAGMGVLKMGGASGRAGGFGFVTPASAEVLWPARPAFRGSAEPQVVDSYHQYMLLHRY